MDGLTHLLVVTIPQCRSHPHVGSALETVTAVFISYTSIKAVGETTSPWPGTLKHSQAPPTSRDNIKQGLQTLSVKSQSVNT